MLVGNLIPGAYAPGAQIDTNRQPLDFECSRLNVWKPGPPSMALGVAYPVTKMQGLSTHIAFDSQFRTS